MKKTRNGNWMGTHCGIKFYPLDPRLEEIELEDIAHALSLLCRFNGHSSEFYSIAEHCWRVSQIVPDKLKLAALLHDSAEAYLSDIPRPFKAHFPEYSKYEDKLLKMIYKKYGISITAKDWKEIKKADNILVATEARDLMGVDYSGQSFPEWDYNGERPLNSKIIPMSSEESKKIFLRWFKFYATTQREVLRSG